MSASIPNTLRSGPDENGQYGDYGGRFVGETLMPLILDLDRDTERGFYLVPPVAGTAPGSRRMALP